MVPFVPWAASTTSSQGLLLCKQDHEPKTQNVSLVFGGYIIDAMIRVIPVIPGPLGDMELRGYDL